MLSMNKASLKKYGLLATPSPKVYLPDINNKNSYKQNDEAKTESKLNKIIKSCGRKRSLVGSKR